MRVAGAVAVETTAGVTKMVPRTVRSGEMEEVGVVTVGNRSEGLGSKVGGKR